MTYVLVHKESCQAVLVWIGEALEVRELHELRPRFDALGYKLCWMSDAPLPTEHIFQAISNLEED